MYTGKWTQERRAGLEGGDETSLTCTKDDGDQCEKKSDT